MMTAVVQPLQVQIGAGDWGAVLPQIILAAGALLLLLLDVLPLPDALARRASRIDLLTGAALVFTIAAGISSVYLWSHGSVAAMYLTVTSDKFSVFFDYVVLLALVLTILMSPSYIQKSTFDPGEYYALLLAAASGMMLMSAGLSLMVLFIALELLSLALYILSGFERGRERSQEAGFKYFLLSSFASAFLIYGMALIYGATGHTQINYIAACLQGNPQAGCAPNAMNSPLLYIGIALMIVGFAFKVSIVPFHMWTPDVYQGAPTPVTAFMSVTTKAVVFAAFVRVFNLTLYSVASHWFGILWVLAVLTMVVGNVLALVQTNMKRLLAYSGVAHAGYVMVAVAANNAAGMTATAFYFLAYTFMNIGAFILVSVLESRGEAGDEIASYRGLYHRSPQLFWFTAVFMFSLAGFPPTSGFIAKYFAFQAIVQAGHAELAVIGVLTSLISIFYYLRITFVMVQPVEEGRSSSIQIPNGADMALAASVAGTIGLGLIPQGFFNMASLSVSTLRSLFNL